MLDASLDQIIGTRIAIARSSRLLAQKELARRINISGSHLCKLEKGQRAITAKLLFAIANELGVDSNKLNPYISLENPWKAPRLPFK